MEDLVAVTSPDAAAAMLDPARLRILEAARQAASATMVAKRLHLPRQKVNYHLRTLEKFGLVEEVEQRRKGNCIERIVRATARRYLISPEVLGELALDAESVRDRFSSSYLVAVAAETIRDLAVLRPRADKAKKKLPTLTVQAEVRVESPAELEAFRDELSAAFVAIAAKYNNASATHGRTFRCFAGAYPKITKIEEKQ